MESCTHMFQISGIKTREKKRVLVQGIQQLGGKYIGGSVYQHTSTHLIIPQVLSSEKFLAACAAVLRKAPGSQRDPMRWPFPQVPHPPSTQSDSGGRRWPVGD
ncbi:hypothetical protein PAMA_018521 [Pampus argenteus]